jgi:AraC family transcriptional regulator of arabinose operon
MIHQDTHITTGVETGYHRVVKGRYFKTRLARVHLPSMGSAPCWDITAAPGQWGADRPGGMREWQVILTLGGEGCFFSGLSSFRARKNSVVLYPPGVAQKYGIDDSCSSWEHLWITFVPRANLLPFMSWPEVISGVFAIALPESKSGRAIRDLMIAAHFQRHSGTTTGHLHATLNIESALLSCSDLQKQSVSPLDPRIAAMLDLIEKEYASALKIDYLAKKCGLSASRLEHLVREETGNPIRVHIENERMRQAKHLLQFTRKTVSEIAYAVGYQSPKHFCTRFKLSERCTATQFRSEHPA